MCKRDCRHQPKKVRVIHLSIVFVTAGPGAFTEERFPDHVFMWWWSGLISVQRIHSSERGQRRATHLRPNPSEGWSQSLSWTEMCGDAVAPHVDSTTQDTSDFNNGKTLPGRFVTGTSLVLTSATFISFFFVFGYWKIESRKAQTL